MRVPIRVFCAVLLVLAVVGLGFGAYIFVHIAAAARAPAVGDIAVLVAIEAAAPVLTLGAVSLGLLVVAATVDRARSEQVALVAEQMRREAPPHDPVLAAKRARVAVEQEARVAAARGEL